MFSLLNFDIGVLRDSLKSVEEEQNRYMNSLKLQNKKISEALARLDILAAVVNDYSMMGSSVRAQSGTSTKVESLQVLEQEKSPIQFASGEIGDDKKINDFRDTITTVEDNDAADEVNTVDTCLRELSTTRPSLTKKAKNKEVANVDIDDLAIGAHHLLSNKVTDEESPHSSPSQVFDEKGCLHLTGLNGTDVADNVVETILLTESESVNIIGKQGTRVNRLRRLTGARIEVTILRGVKKGKVVIKGRADQAKKALEMIKEIVGDTVMARLTYSSKLNVRGAFLGENGYKVRELERSTNTVIGIDRVSGRHGEKDVCGQITVKGLRDDVIKAVKIIQQVKGVGEYVLDKIC